MHIDSVFRLFFWALLGGLWLMRMYFKRRGYHTGDLSMAIEREGEGLFAGRSLILFFLMAILVLYAYDSPWLKKFSIAFPLWLRWAGAAVGVIGLVLWTWTQAVLGKQWSPQLQLRQQHHLVTHGPYQWIRHPMYNAMFDVGVALALLSANWCFVLFAAAMIAGFMVRAPREERMMLEAFGERYQVYMQKTGRFIPKWRTLASG